MTWPFGPRRVVALMVWIVRHKTANRVNYVHQGSGRQAGGPGPTGQTEMNYTKIYNDSNGVSQFQDIEVAFSPGDFASSAHPLLTSGFRSADAGFVSVPSGWDSGWHNAPGDGFAILLQGTVEIEVGSGEIRRFSPGDVWRSTDVSGRGHISRIVGEGDATIFMTVFTGSERPS